MFKQLAYLSSFFLCMIGLTSLSSNVHAQGTEEPHGYIVEAESLPNFVNTILAIHPELRQTLWETWIEYLNASNQVEHWLQNTGTKSEEPAERITMGNN